LLYNDIVHEFGEITQNMGHYAVQSHSRSPILVQIDFLKISALYKSFTYLLNN